jgi:hypothetical protein
MISRHGDAAAEAFARVFKAADVVALPAVEANWNSRELGHGGARIHTEFNVFGLRKPVRLVVRLGGFDHDDGFRANEVL